MAPSPKLNFLNAQDEQDFFDGLIRVNRFDYKPHAVGIKLHMSHARKRLNVGGLGCVRESTRIVTDHGSVPIGSITGPTRYASWDGERLVWAPGTAPFPKGKENLLRVRHELGEFVCAEHHLIFCADGKYRPAGSLSAGDALFHPGASPYAGALRQQKPTSWELFQSELPSGAQHYSRRFVDWLDRCSIYFHQYGQPLLLDPNNGQSSAQQLADVREWFQSRARGDGLSARAQEHTHLDQWFAPLASRDCERRDAELAAIAGGSHASEPAERISLYNQRVFQSLLRFFSHPKDRGFFADRTDKFPFYPSSSTTKPTILVKERLQRAEWFWDLQVPGTNNYLAEGAIHHNSGKTRAMCQHIDAMLLKYPGGQGVLARKDLGDLKKTAQTEYLEKVVAPETVDRFNINDNTLYYKNGSKLYFMETKTPSNFKSLELICYGVEEADENEEGQGKDRLMTMLDGRLRQRIRVGGVDVPVPYAGIWTYNPTTDEHWLAKLEDHPESGMEVFRSTTYDNIENLPPDYIPSLLASLAPWEIQSLVWGKRASRPKGKPVIHGFTMEANVRPLKVFHHLPLRRSWDFGFNHPCVSIFQYDPEFKRFMKHRELIGNMEQLKLFAPKVLELTRSLVSPGFPTHDVADPHGADQRDVGESSVEYLRIHHGVFCQFKRQKIKTGLDEIQEMVLTKAKFRPVDWTPDQEVHEEARFLVDPSCRMSIAAYMGGYYRGADGLPEKDDLHDHYVDSDRYGTAHIMGLGLAAHMKKHNRYVPRSIVTGY